MVGGEVIETVPYRDERGQDLVWVNCAGMRGEEGLECAVDLKDTPVARSISEGDQLWWQAGYAYWTPKGRAFGDMKIERVGYSGVPRPKVPA